MNRALWKCIISLPLFWNSLAFGAAFNSQLWFTEIKACYERAFFDPKIYNEQWCSQNIKNLYDSCFHQHREKIREFGLEQPRVIYLVQSYGQAYLERNEIVEYVRPIRSRVVDPAWGFHVYLEFNGLVFDMDYTAKPKIVSLAKYFDDQFFLKTYNYVMRAIPALEYSRDYDENGAFNYRYYVKAQIERYPRVFVADYLESLKAP